MTGSIIANEIEFAVVESVHLPISLASSELD